MASSTSSVRQKEIDSNIPSHNSLSKLKTYGFAIVIIMAIGGLAVSGVGVAGFFHVGALSNLSQINAIIMMAVGGGMGIILLVAGGAGLKNCKRNHQQIDDDQSHTIHHTTPVKDINAHKDTEKKDVAHQIKEPEHDDTIRNTAPVKKVDTQQDTEQKTDVNHIIKDAAKSKSIDTQGGVFYGPQAWEVLGVKVLDTNIQMPKVDLSKNDKILLYIPETIEFKGVEKNLTLDALIEIGSVACPKSVLKELGNSTAPGWILIDKAKLPVIPNSRGKTFKKQKKMVKKECQLTSTVEAVALNLLIFALTNKPVHGMDPVTSIRCSDVIKKPKGKYPVVVGEFGNEGLCINDSYLQDIELGRYGITTVERFKAKAA